jgi:hypothetical protein
MIFIFRLRSENPGLVFHDESRIDTGSSTSESALDSVANASADIEVFATKGTDINADMSANVAQQAANRNKRELKLLRLKLWLWLQLRQSQRLWLLRLRLKQRLWPKLKLWLRLKVKLVLRLNLNRRLLSKIKPTSQRTLQQPEADQLPFILQRLLRLNPARPDLALRTFGRRRRHFQLMQQPPIPEIPAAITLPTSETNFTI